MALDTERMLDLIGVREGWSCLDIGCGPGGITWAVEEARWRDGDAWSASI
jgi:ubiquinone/menaquinone biosynthesis C-methylase UbiE